MEHREMHKRVMAMAEGIRNGAKPLDYSPKVREGLAHYLEFYSFMVNYDGKKSGKNG